MQQTQSPKAGERTQHTPGPWRIDGDLDTLCVVAGDYSLIGEIHTEDINPPRYEEAEANARLIAAAPDGNRILEMLRNFTQEGSSNIHFHALMPEGADETETLAEAIKMYFAKAEGRAP